MNSVDQLLGIKGRLAMIVGAAGGYGRQCALTLAENGANVALIDRNQEELEITQAMVLAGNPEAIGNCYILAFRFAAAASVVCSDFDSSVSCRNTSKINSYTWCI